MKIGNVAVTLCLAVLASDTLAQTDSFFSEVMEVRVTNVDVIVTGRDGKPVTGLTREDFELFEDGVRKDISNFLEIRGGPIGSLTTMADRGGAAPVASGEDIRRRDITVFVDNAALHPFRRNAILPHLQQFVERNVRPGDTVTIATWGRSLKLELEPTSDRAAIEAAMKRLTTQVTMGNEGQQGRDEFQRAVAALIRLYASMRPPAKPPFALAINEARSYAMKVSHAARQRVEALKSIIAWKRGAEGRKILVIIAPELQVNPAEEVFMYLDGVRDEFENPAGTAMSEAKEFEHPSLIHEVTTVANSSGVTLYPIDAAGKQSGMDDRSAESTPRFTNAGRMETGSLQPTFRSIAAETGGIAMSGSDNWKLAFDTITNDLETYYSLGYRSAGERQDRMKNIEVKLKNKRHNVRTRRAVIEKSITSEMQDAVASNLFRPSVSNDLAIRAAAGAATPKDEASSVIPITVTVPMEKLTLVPEGTDLTARFALYAAFLRKDGAVSKVAQQPGAVRFPADSLKRRKELTVRIDVTVDSQTNGLSVGLIDELSRATGFAAVKLKE